MSSLIAPPNNLKAEASLLGCLLIKGIYYYEISEQSGLTPEDFYDMRHQLIYRAIQELGSKRKTPDIITVAEELSSELDNIGDDYLRDLTDQAPVTSEHAIKEYAEIIIEKSLYRQLIQLCDDSLSGAYRQEQSFIELIDAATGSLLSLSNKRQERSVVSLRSVIKEEISKLDDRMKSGKPILGVPSGYPKLDEITNGFKEGDMIVVAGRPGMGKTSFALNMAIEMAKKDFHVLFFSLEMPASQLGVKIISTECCISSKDFMTGQLSQDDCQKMWSQIDMIQRLPIFIDDSPNLTVAELRAKSKKVMHDNKKLDIIFIDYIGLMQSNIFKEDRVRQIEHISRNIKLLAKEMRIPVVALAQVNREAEKHGVPMLSNLRDSGSLEQDADLVMFVHREELNNSDSQVKGMASIHVKKNRLGQTGEVSLRFIAQYTKFGNIDFNASEDYNV